MLLVEMSFCSSELGSMGNFGREVRMNDDVYVIEREGRIDGKSSDYGMWLISLRRRGRSALSLDGIDY